MGAVADGLKLAGLCALGACLLTGCDWDPGEPRRPASSRAPGASLASRDLEPVMVKLEDLREPSLSGIPLEALRVSRLSGELDAPSSVSVKVSLGPLGAIQGRDSAPAFNIFSAPGEPPLGLVMLTIPYGKVAGRGKPSIVSLHSNGRVGWIPKVEIDSAAGTATFLAQVPGVYVAMPEGLVPDKPSDR